MKIEKFTLGIVQTNAYLLTHEDTCILFDAPTPASILIESIKDYKNKYLYLTHGHFDHILGAFELKKAYPELEIIISKEDSSYLINKAKKAIYDLTAMGLPDPMINEDITFSYLEDTPLLYGFEYMYTPGHTKGSVCFINNNLNLIIAGDTVFKDGYGRTDLPGGSNSALFTSIKSLLKLEKKLVVLPGHGPNTTIDELNSFFLFSFTS